MLPSEWTKDFRGPAIQVSLQLLSETQQDDPASANVSCCLPTEHPQSSLKVQKWMAIGCLIMGFVGLGGGAAIASWAEKQEETNWLLLSLAMCCTFSGFVFLILPVKGGGLFIRGYLGRRLSDLKSDPNISEVFYMAVEDPETFSKMKLTSEDVGYLALDPVNQRVIIEGALCRYVIRSEDIIRVKSQFASGSPGTLIAFRIGENARLGIMIEKQYLWAETVRQLTGKTNNPACKKIAAALGVEPE